MAAYREGPLRVVLTGSESTGKSTLARELAEHFGTGNCTEFVRRYLNDKRAPLSASDVEPIARGQIAAEDAAAAWAKDVAIFDTDLLSTVIYARHYYGSCPEWIVRAARDRKAGLYLLLDIDVPWVPDPQRDRGDRRDEMQELFRAGLEEAGANWITISGSWEERKRQAIALCTQSLSG